MIPDGPPKFPLRDNRIDQPGSPICDLDDDPPLIHDRDVDDDGVADDDEKLFRDDTDDEDVGALHLLRTVYTLEPHKRAAKLSFPE